MTTGESSTHRWTPTLIALALVAATVAAYWPVRHNGFVDFDDPSYVTENYHVRGGLKLAEIGWVFTHFYYYNYSPLTLLSHMLDVQLFGLNPAGHHFMNVAIHALNSVLLFLLFLRMTGARWRSAFVAAAFALHPQHVESVAWIAERKDVLSTFFWICAMLAYTQYARRPAWWRYLIVAVCMALGLLSKPMLVTLPFVLLLMDYWPLERPVRYGWGRLALEKVPLLALSLASCVITILAQDIAVSTTQQLPLLERLALVPSAYTAYIWQMIWPAGLAVMYPRPPHISLVPVAIAALALIAATAYAFRLRRDTPYLFVGWCWFLGTLVPVIGIVQVGAQAMADRYTYIPLIGLFIVMAWGARDLARRNMKSPTAAFPKWADATLAAMAVCILLAWGVVTRNQLDYWRDSHALFERAVQVNPANPLILTNIGSDLMRNGRVSDAIPYYRRALQIASFAEGYANLAIAVAAQGHLDEATQLIEQGLAQFPRDPVLQRSAGMVYGRKGDLSAAAMHLEEALRLNPSDLVARRILASVYVHNKELDRAMDQVQQVLAVAPGDPDSIFNLGTIYAARGQMPEAIEQFRKFIAAAPNDAEGHYELAKALAQSGKSEESVRELRETLRCNPRHRGAQKALEGQ